MKHGTLNKQFRKEFSLAEQTFFQNLADYQDHLDALALKKRWRISKDVMKQVDTLSSITRTSLRSYLDLKAKLHKHYESAVQAVKEKEHLAGSYTYTIEDELTLDTGRSIVDEANDLFLSDHILLAIDKVYDANRCFSEMIVTIRNRWIEMHQQTITLLYQE